MVQTRMDATALDLDALADRIALTAASLDAATHTLLTDLRDFDTRHGWAAQGMKSCAEWLSWKCGIALGAAREKVRVAQGMVRIEAQLRPDEAARVLAACDVFAASAAERPDALLTMAEATLRGDEPDRPPVEILLHIDADTLTGAQGGTGISAETSRRLLCDAGVRPVSGDHVGRKSRVFAGALRRALFARAGGCCQFPGCSHTRYLHGHHVRHWIDGGATSLDNALLLCTRHHTLVHEGGFSIVTDENGPQFLRPDGRRVSTDDPPDPVALRAAPRLPPVWDGDRVDYDWALDSVASR